MCKTALMVMALLLAGSLGVLAWQAAPVPAVTNQQPARTAASVELDPQLQAALEEIAGGGSQMSTSRPVSRRTWVCSLSCQPCGGLGAFCPRGTGQCVRFCP
jgi:hypothetical protein